MMRFFIENKLNAKLFDRNIRKHTNELNDILFVAIETQSPKIESTHFLIGLSFIPDGITNKQINKIGLTEEHWKSGLSECACNEPGCLPLAEISEDVLHQSSIDLFNDLEQYLNDNPQEEISEGIMLLYALKNAPPAVKQLFESAGINFDELCDGVKDSLKPVENVNPFKDDEAGSIDFDVFTPSGKKVLKLLKTETESLGYDIADPRHMFMGLLNFSGGTCQYCLHSQKIIIKDVQEAVMLSLRNKMSHNLSTLSLDRDHFQPILSRIFCTSGEFAGRDRQDAISEKHLAQAFLAIDSSGLRILLDENANVTTMQKMAENYELLEEEDDLSIADIQSVRTHILDRLVGQDHAVERILPYIQRMKFGFSTPDRPIGVFLFCGQSGSGKTELAKELARAVYGSEDNMIFLEMGQFNKPESMNIFIGSPPGYVGYGEGKLTNGLRDKPCSVVLFDEIEKADPKVFDALLRFIDEGRIDDPGGPVRDGSQCIVVLTSNVGAEELSKLWKEIEGKPSSRMFLKQKVRAAFRESNFRVEFLNRIDELVLFKTLSSDDYTEIARRVSMKHIKRLNNEREIEIDVDKKIYQSIGEYCGAIGEGARATNRLVLQTIVTPVIDYIIQNSIIPPIKLKVKLAPPKCDEEVPEPVSFVEI
jgi:ATP-dependent Clp protease ATP-binding subunit ClpA